MGTCETLPAGAGFISSMTNFLDCQAQVLGSGAYQALAAPGSTLAVLLTGFLTIFIALIGYNLLLGHSLTVRTGTLAFVKIGAVLALATSWPAYRTLVYDLMVDGPAQIVSDVGRPTGVVGSDGTLLQRLDLTDSALVQLSILGPGNAALPAGTQIAPPPFGGFDAFALGGSRILYLLTALASLGALRIITGIMLALGPFFIAFFMFDSTRSLFEGWVRVLAGSALATIGVSIALGIELALMEPWLSGVLARRMAGEALPTVSTELFVIATLFAVIVAAVLFASARVARAFRLPPILRLMPVALETGRATASVREPLASNQRMDGERSRAAAVAGVLVSMNRRERIAGESGEGERSTGTGHRSISTSLRSDSERQSPPVGRSFRRQARTRVSASADRRDLRT
jgi:type IV secretion system protein VirB6